MNQPANQPDLAKALARAAQEVMDLLAEHGAGIVGHLLDTDNNPGQRLRDLTARVLNTPTGDRLKSPDCDWRRFTPEIHTQPPPIPKPGHAQ